MDINNLEELIKNQLPLSISETNFDIGKRYKGKVRDVYDLGDKLLIIASDRISAFDHVLGIIPFKGEILTNLSLFWFNNTNDIIKNHIIKQIHANAILVKKCKIIPIEVIIRGYLTGGGWREYSKTGLISGIKLPEGLKKDCKFENPIFTPTTKAQEGHDLPISKQEIIEKGIMDKDLINNIEEISLKLFKRGTKLAKKNNLILVDTKYEFGLLDDGSLILADEIHTSDSSRYWYLDSYEKLLNLGQKQKMLDKEYFRQWLIDHNYIGEGQAPELSFEVITGICEKYLKAYETITGEKYKLENKDSTISLNEAVEKLKSEL